jgi:bifunctional DNA-binding transcriptional regulator/antitoxin component of YhaV-PrlF toxin-antitoxin module
MKKDEAYTFIAKMDSKGRLRIPANGREANGYKPGARFNVMILALEDKE